MMKKLMLGTAVTALMLLRGLRASAGAVQVEPAAGGQERPAGRDQER